MPGVSINKPGMPGYSNPSFMSGSTSPSQAAMNNFGSATNQAGQDYSDIMNKYRSLYDAAGNAGSTLGANLNYNVTIPTYQTSGDYRNAINNLSSLSQNGGYSAQDLSDLRARGVAPIRAAYQNAQNDITRQRTLQGGYSPNFTAASAKMAREMSSQMADQVTNVNAGIAQNVAANKIATATPYASITAGEQANRNQFDLESANMANQFGLNRLNAQIQSYALPFQTKLSALSGMRDMYGTTPATANMLGTDALNIAQLQEAMKQNNIKNGLATASLYGGA